MGIGKYILLVQGKLGMKPIVNALRCVYDITASIPLSVYT